jgi:hypothetical protein
MAEAGHTTNCTEEQCAEGCRAALRQAGHSKDCMEEQCDTDCGVFAKQQLDKKIKRLDNPEDWVCFSCKSAECDGCSGYRRNRSWQAFGEEYNDYGELISSLPEPLAGHDWQDRQREERDRSGAYWQEPEDYKEAAYKALGIGTKWDNVRRDPVLQSVPIEDQDDDFVPDR